MQNPTQYCCFEQRNSEYFLRKRRAWRYVLALCNTIRQTLRQISTELLYSVIV